MTWLDIITMYVMIYPSATAFLWMIGGIYYFFTQEEIGHITSYDANDPTFVTIMVPCYNEAANIDETVEHLLNIRYTNYEILLINDGSRDDTARLIDGWAACEPKIRALHQENQGKATALNNGIKHARGEILVCIDGDAVLDYDAISYLVKAMKGKPNVAAITGNPRVRTRTTIIGKLQVTEFSSIIGLTKRTQSVYGTIFTISGVIGAFRKSAMESIGGWSPDMITEDIDVSWKLQMMGYDILFEANALCWVLMPETLKGLYKQRLRWAQGGAEVFLKFFKSGISWSGRRFWPHLFEYAATLTWAYSMLGLIVLRFFDPYLLLHPEFNWHILRSTSFIILCICMIQFTVSLYIDSHYERGLWRSFIWCIWYPLAYWTLNLITMTIAFPKALFRKRGQLAVWSSPDRGVSL
ncbi:poly-beta-1,6 N-acetyl-D-glucosamine synthase [Formosimonas limnophila]|uniref:Poly-beta-1,6-N-acetyl-D-glucosamine synthase n=1 Tax=Formosimonas limnophila TaxID=1384487 RepID=A0A8J3CLH2_9BURK|nr:poly-beta-1,6-N-acetyl-D-glucosamine synthase [Formosimonas limnophila]GHA66711.1 poly-beta-1,6 N-acetyl-D-glucosamine synthase [Formosimonas limnophila]